MTDSYKSDTWILKMFTGWFDTCPYNEDWDYSFENGLDINWPDLTYVNPPYSNPKPWVEKAIMENKMFNKTIAMLLKHDTSTHWYKLIHESGGHVLMINGRLKHQTGKSCSFPSILVIWEGTN